MENTDEDLASQVAVISTLAPNQNNLVGQW